MVPPSSPIQMSPPGTKASTTGSLRPPASWVCVKPAGRPGPTLVLVVPDPVNGEPDSVPVTVAVSGITAPAAASCTPVIVTVHTCPAGRAAAVQVTLLVLELNVQLPVLVVK